MLVEVLFALSKDGSEPGVPVP